MNENYLDRFGNQPATMSYLIVRADQISKYTPKQIAKYNHCTDKENGNYYITWNDPDQEGERNDADIMEDWASDQNLDESAYTTLNWLLLKKGRQIILPPIKP